MNIQELAAAFREAANAAHDANPHNDWGTCNMDNVILAPHSRANVNLMQKALKIARLPEAFHFGKWLGLQCYVFPSGHKGQGDQRAMMVEAAYHNLRSSLEGSGIDVLHYQQMD